MARGVDPLGAGFLGFLRLSQFSIAKAEGMDAYKAYKAAFDNAEVLECAFCNCGCYPEPGHLSATDCFKDMHGFT